jgi:hypothetical protein
MSAESFVLAGTIELSLAVAAASSVNLVVFRAHIIKMY